MSIDSILEKVLKEPPDAIRYSLSKTLSEQFPHLGLVETSDGGFDLDEFSREGHCAVEVLSPPHAQSDFGWHRTSYESLENIWRRVTWEDEVFDVVTISRIVGSCDETRSYILGPSRETVLQFFETVCAWNYEVRGEILIYHGRSWYKSAELYESIRKASFEDLILAGTMLEEIKNDFERFLARKETYELHGIPWKRGVLFLGPPGNGKTQTVKALANSLGIPVLYVRSLKSQYGTDHDSIRTVFQRARDNAPCLLVLEDIDSLIDSGNRSFFLNEMDGFSANTGIITLATANHPEKLDPAILDRPSRFDRKYNFSLPGVSERARYIRKLSNMLEGDLQLTEEGVERLAQETSEFSFAYIKELFLSGMMQWIDEDRTRPMDEVLRSLVAPLRAQMKSSATAVAMAELDPQEDNDMSFAMPRR